MKKLSFFIAILQLFCSAVFAQVGINADNSTPDNSAMLDVKSVEKGLLIPRVALTATNVAGPITNPATSLLVYNTATAGASPNNVTPGYYYWNGSAWTRLSVSIAGSGTTNYLSKWTSANALGNSLLYDDGNNIGIGTTSPASSAPLDVSSTNKGILPPRMSHLQRNAIASPVAGLVIWCNTCGATGELQVYNGTTWTNMVGGSVTPGIVNGNIGDTYQGGKIAYILQSGDPGYIEGEFHGLIITPGDQGTAEWGCLETEIAGADGTALGTGNQNTIDIMNGCTQSGIAARKCGDLVLNGYDDWYLPSKDELNKLYINHGAIGGFTDEPYWSSTEYNAYFAWYRYFYIDYQNVTGKEVTIKVRAVRTF
jgi:hypothetical protein